MPGPIVGVILAALLVSGVAGAALAVSHTATAAPCPSSNVMDSTQGAHSYDDQNQTENETDASNDLGCAGSGAGTDNSPDSGNQSLSVRLA